MKKSGFTIVEIIVVLIIVGMIAAFTIPNYTRSIQATMQKEAVANLKMIYAAAQIVRARTGAIPNNLNDIGDNQDAINAAFHTNIMDSSGLEYKCDTNACNAYKCTAGSGCALTLALTQFWVYVQFDAGADSGVVQCTTCFDHAAGYKFP